MHPKVYIIVLNYRNWEDTIECLESLLKLDYENFQIIVVDNASGNDSLTYLKNWAKGNFCLYLPNDNSLKKYSFPLAFKPLSYEHYFSGKAIDIYSAGGPHKIIFIESSVNGGYSGGNNLGIEYALSCKDADYFWILNNDTTLPSDSLLQMIKDFEKEKNEGKKIGMMGSKLIYYHNPKLIQNVGAYYMPAFAYSKITAGGENDSERWNTENVRINHIVGASILSSVNFVLEIGKFSEDYFLYMEEIDWAIRARRKGWQIKYCPNAKIFHKEGVSINEGNIFAISGVKSKMSEYYWTRNKILITKKYYPYFLPLVIVSSLLAILKKIKRGHSARTILLLKAIYHGLTGYKISPESLNK